MTSELPDHSNDDILNYSIISSDDEDKPLVLKLKVSKSNSPVVLLNRLNVDNLISPRKSARTRRTNSKLCDSYVTYNFGTPSKRPKSRELLHTPTTRARLISSPHDRNSLASKENIKVTPKRCNEKETEFFENTPIKKDSSPRRGSLSHSTPTYKTRRQSSITPSYDDGDCNRYTRRINLNESIRRSIFKKAISEESKNETSDGTKIIKGNMESLSNTIRTRSLSNSNSENLSSLSDSSVNMSGCTPNLKQGTECESEDSDISESESVNEKSSRRMRSPRRTLKTEMSKNISKCSKSDMSQKTPRSKKLECKTTTPRTPKNLSKLIKNGSITPSIHKRSESVKKDSTPLMKACSQLHVSYVPTALPCREKEYCDIRNFLEGKLKDGCGGCMYISGVPGTGKTATVTAVINNLQIKKGIKKFSYINVNGMKLSEPRQAYVEILKQLSGKFVSWEQAQSTLEEKFTGKSHTKLTTPIVMVIDELDILCTKRQDVVYNLLDWPTKAKNQLIVITIANAMDLPERLLMNRVTSRLGLTRLTFQAYTHKQLQEIVTTRLVGTNSFNPDAVQFVARKIASVSGDARRALDICRRAAEIAESEGKEQLVSMNHVNDALNAMITQPKVRAIKHCSRLEQLILQSIVAEVERTGVEETTFLDIYKMLSTCCAIEGFKAVSITRTMASVSRLSSCRLILTDPKCNNIYQRIILNVSNDDVYFALRKK